MLVGKLFRTGARGRTGMLREAVGNQASVDNWIKTITSKATTPEGKMFTGQLGSVVSFYNKTPTTSDPVDVNWEDWTNRISTRGLVEKIRGNTETLLKERYNVATVAEKISGEPTEDYNRISSELQYHYNLWGIYYQEHVECLVQLEEIGNMLSYKPEDCVDRFFGLEAESQRRLETGHNIPGAVDDINVAYYMANQFVWGRNQVTFYRHPMDDFKSVMATKNILGR